MGGALKSVAGAAANAVAPGIGGTIANAVMGGGGGGGGGGSGGPLIDADGIVSDVQAGSEAQRKIAEAQREADNEQTKQSILTTITTQTNKMAREAMKQVYESAAEDTTAHGRKASQGYRA